MRSRTAMLLILMAGVFLFQQAFAQEAPAPVPKTGQKKMHTPGDDGGLEAGVAWPVPRFTDNTDGTITDNLTGLVWLKNASCVYFYEGNTTGHNYRQWIKAILAANLLASGYCGLSDGSVAGDWRLPNVKEMQSLLAYGFREKAIPNTTGLSYYRWGDPFINVGHEYWTSTAVPWYPDAGTNAYYVNVDLGLTFAAQKKGNVYSVWAVRNAK